MTDKISSRDATHDETPVSDEVFNWMLGLPTPALVQVMLDSGRFKAEERAYFERLLDGLRTSRSETPRKPDYERCFDAAFKALKLLNSTRPTWNGPIHRAAALLLEATGPQPETPVSATALNENERAELERLRSQPSYWAQNNGAVLEDSDRYRWFRDDCDRERQEEIIESADGKADMLDHHIDKGRCGL